MTTRQTPDAVREAVARIVDRFEAYCLAIADRPTSAKRDEWIGELSILRRMMFGATTPAALESRAGDAGEIETAENGEAMVCTGCGTTRTVVAIVRRYANGVMTYVVRNILASKPWVGDTHSQVYQGLRTDFIRRRLIALEKAGKVKRVRSGYAVMLCWAIA
jgi:hypothetical protein